MHPFDDYSITAGRVITGANPASARSGAERALKAFDELPTAQARDGKSVAVATWSGPDGARVSDIRVTAAASGQR